MTLVMSPGNEVRQFGLVLALEGDGIDLDFQPGLARRLDAVQCGPQIAAAAQAEIAARIQRIERDIDAGDARRRQTGGVLRQPGGIGGHGQLVQRRSDMAA